MKNKWKVAIRLLMLIIIVGIDFSPVLLNAQEVEEQISTSVNKKKALDEEKTNITFNDKSGFIKNSNGNYVLTFTSYQNMDLVFDYDMIDGNKGYDQIKVNGNDYILSDVITVLPGDNIVEISEKNYNNLKSLDIQTITKPEILTELNNEEMKIKVSSPIGNIDVDMEIDLPDYIQIDEDNVPLNFVYNKHLNKLKITSLKNSQEYNIPFKVVDTDSETESDEIIYKYTYRFDGIDEYYEAEKQSIVSVPRNIVSTEERSINNKQTREDTCTGYTNKNFYYSGEDSVVADTECGISLGTNDDGIDVGISMFEDYISIDENFNINFTVEHVNNKATGSWGFYLMNPDMVGYNKILDTLENVNDLAPKELEGYYMYISYEGAEPGIHYGFIYDRVDENDKYLDERGYISDFGLTSSPIENLTFDISYNSYVDTTGSVGSNILTTTISSTNSSITPVTFEISLSLLPSNIILEFVSNFEENPVNSVVNIKLNSFSAILTEPMVEERLKVNKGVENIIGGNLEYEFKATNTSNRYDETINKNTLISDLEGNVIDSSFMVNSTIPTVEEILLRQNIDSSAATYTQNIVLNFATVADFLGNRDLVLPDGIKVQTDATLKYRTLEVFGSEFKYTNEIKYVIDDIISSMSSSTNYKRVELNSTVGTDQKIDLEDVVDLFDLNINDGYLTPAGATTVDLFNSDRMIVDDTSIFPISTTVEGKYTFILKYKTAQGEILNLPLTIEVKETEPNIPISIGHKVKNVAYGTDQDGDIDNGVGTITQKSYEILQAEYKIDALNHQVTMRLTFGDKLYEGGVTTDSNRNIHMYVSGTSSPTLLYTEDDPNGATASYIGESTLDGQIVYNYEVKTEDLRAKGFADDGMYTILFTDGSSSLPVRVNNTKKITSSFSIQVPKIEEIDGVPYSVIGDGINGSTDASDISDKDVSTPETVAYSTTTETLNAVSAYGVYELESICYEDANSSFANWTDSDLTLTKYDHVVRPCNGNYKIEEDIDATQTKLNTEADNLGGFDDDGFRSIGQKIITSTGEDSLEFTGIINGNKTELVRDRSKTSSKITNLYINEPTLNNIGMVSINNGTLTNLGLYTENDSAIYIIGTQDVGSIAGENKQDLINVYSHEGVLGSGDYVGGLVGNNSASISHSYATGSVKGENFIGGLTGNLNSGEKVDNSYALGDIEGSGENVGGLIGQNLGIILDTYAIGAVAGESSIGGLVGDNVGTIVNSYGTGNIEGSRNIGGLVGNNTGTLTNSYGYKVQTINGIFIDYTSGSSQVVGNDSSYTNAVGYLELTDNQWYDNTLGTNTSGVQNEIGYDYTSPWKIEKDDRLATCYPHIYRDEKDGKYVPDQECYKIGLPVEYKINAMTLDITFKYPKGIISDVDIRVKNINSGEEIFDNLILDPKTSEIILDAQTTFTNIEQDTDMEITFISEGKELTATFHMPSQITTDYDMNQDGVIAGSNEIGVTFALIGDGVNEATDVDDLFPSDVSTPFTLEEAGIMSSEVAGAPAYGVYELESIGYENNGVYTDMNQDGVLDLWVGNDLTLYKYDHIVRPYNGKYMIQGGIDASNTKEGTTLVRDNKGGWSSDTNGDGIADANDGFNPLGIRGGYLVGEDLDSESNEPKISNLYENNFYKNSHQGMIGDFYTGYVSNIKLENVDISGSKNVGGLAGSMTSTGYIYNSYVTGDVSGTGDYIGGLVGWSKGNIFDSYSTASVQGDDGYIGGLVGYMSDGNIYRCYSTSNIDASDQYAGGLVGYSYDGSIEDSYATGNVLGTSALGGLVGYNKSSIKRSYATGDVTGSNYVGGLIGNNSNGIHSSYATGDVSSTGDYIGGLIGYNQSGITDTYATGDVTGNNNVGGLVGYNQSGITGTYATGNVLGNSNVGGLVGLQIKTFKIINSFATSDVSGDEQVGKLVGNIGSPDGSSAAETIQNSYAYDAQKVFENDVIEENVIGNDQSYDSHASYEEVTDNTWYTDTLTWNSDLDSAGEKIIIWGDLYTEDSKLCYPNLADGIGTYITEQKCNEIKMPDSVKVAKNIENYKINAYTLTVTIKLKDVVKSSSLLRRNQISVKIENLTDPTTYPAVTLNEDIINDNFLVLEGEDYNIQPDSDIKITFTVEGVSNELQIHTPKQTVVDYDIDGSGKIENDEKNLKFALIGDGVNTDTDIDNMYDTDISTPSTLLSNGTTSSQVTGAPAYGIYELESICSNDSLTSEQAWTTSDLTLIKYDHIIRPCGGKYMLATDVDASIVKTLTGEDTVGEFDIDGFNPIVSFRGALVGLDIPRSQGSTIDSLYGRGNKVGLINTSSYSYVNNISLENLDLEGTGYTAGLSADSYHDTIRNVSVTGSIKGGTTTGGIVAYSRYSAFKNLTSNLTTLEGGDNTGGIIGRGVNGSVNDSIVMGDIVGRSYSGGIIGYSTSMTVTDSYTLGDVTGMDYVGGLIGRGSDYISISNSYAIGDVTGTNYVGGLIGRSDEGRIKNSYAIGDVTGTNYVGGLMGQGVEVDTIDSYATGDVTGTNYVGGLMGVANRLTINNSYYEGNVKGTEYVGGLVGQMFNSSSGSTTDKNTMVNSYSKGTVEGMDRVGGLIGGLLGKSYIGNNYSTSNVNIIDGTSSSIEPVTYVGGLIGKVTSQTGYNSPGNYLQLVIANNYYAGNIESNLTISKSYNVGGIVGGYEKTVRYTDFHLNNNLNIGNIKLQGVDATNLNVGGIVGSLSETGTVDGDLFLDNNLNIGNIEVLIDSSDENNVGKVIGSFNYPLTETGYKYLNNYYYSEVTCTNTGGTCSATGADSSVNPNTEIEKSATKTNLYDRDWWLGKIEEPTGEITAGLGFNLYDTDENNYNNDDLYHWDLLPVESGSYPILKKNNGSYELATDSSYEPVAGQESEIPLPTRDELTQEQLKNIAKNNENKNNIDISSTQKNADIQSQINDDTKSIKDEQNGDGIEFSSSTSNVQYSYIKQFMDSNRLNYYSFIKKVNSQNNTKLNEVLNQINQNLEINPNYLKENETALKILSTLE